MPVIIPPGRKIAVKIIGNSSDISSATQLPILDHADNVITLNSNYKDEFILTGLSITTASNLVVGLFYNSGASKIIYQSHCLANTQVWVPFDPNMVVPITNSLWIKASGSGVVYWNIYGYVTRVKTIGLNGY